jgi:hypothetical protein
MSYSPTNGSPEKRGLPNQWVIPAALDSPLLNPDSEKQQKTNRHTLGTTFQAIRAAQERRKQTSQPSSSLQPLIDSLSRLVYKNEPHRLQYTATVVLPKANLDASELPTLEHTAVIPDSQPPTPELLSFQPNNVSRKTQATRRINASVYWLTTPLRTMQTHHAISRLNPQDKAIVHEFLHPTPKPPVQDDPPSSSVPNSHRLDYAPYRITNEFPAIPTPKENALEKLSDMLLEVPFLKQSTKIRTLYEGFTEHHPGQRVDIRLTNTGDTVCSLNFPSGESISIFFANPADADYPHKYRIATSLHKTGEKARFSLRTSNREQTTIQEITLQIARLTQVNPKRPDHVYQRYEQKQHLFLTAISAAYQQQIPISQNASARFTGSSWPRIYADQVLAHQQQSFQAQFYLHTNSYTQQIPPSSAMQPKEDDLLIDSYMNSDNLFYTLPKVGNPYTIVPAEQSTDENLETMAKVWQHALVFLSATRAPFPMDTSKAPETLYPHTLQRMDEVIARLQQFVLNYAPNGHKILNFTAFS